MMFVHQGLPWLLMVRQQAAHLQHGGFPVLRKALCHLRRQVLDHAAGCG